ncbi:hypothetical protein H5410_050239 [Solanum commersonii]|uniref:Uncharacterized protein n=1 Tax=Solanum commersonii TaxID=4109 RepID=A0A9J5WX08_SOLCO|nr:hypothetical protein H5410_050239 [Solanum commersonii]
MQNRYRFKPKREQLEKKLGNRSSFSMFTMIFPSFELSGMYTSGLPIFTSRFPAYSACFCGVGCFDDSASEKWSHRVAVSSAPNGFRFELATIYVPFTVERNRFGSKLPN